MDVASAHSDPRAVELLGRDVELARLYGLIDSIDQHGGALVVRGEAGIGKSALLAAASERALQRGVTVESTTGALSEARLAFAGLHQPLLPLLDRLELLPDPQRRALETAFGIAATSTPTLGRLPSARRRSSTASRSPSTPSPPVLRWVPWSRRC
jgi:hypothetical protein